MTTSHFTKLADAQDVDAKTVERDYVLTHVLTGIYEQPGSEHMAFKGGTALRLCYFDDYRYSADLDFSLTHGLSQPDAVALVSRTLTAVEERVGFPHRRARLDVDEVWLDFEEKSRHKEIDPDRFPEAFARRLPSWKKRWDSEMEDHVPAASRQHFDAVEREVRRALRSHLG